MSPNDITDAWIDEMYSALTNNIVKRYKLDKSDKRTCAITVWNIMNPNDRIEPVNTEALLDEMMEVLYSNFGDKLLFKGGYILMKLIPENARLSHDIDFSINDEQLYNKVLNVLIEFAESLISRGVAAKYTTTDTITPTSSGGIKIYDINGSMLIGADVGLHDTSFGYCTRIILNNNITTFSYERMLSDKITATLSRRRFRRTKDLYDIYIIMSKSDIDINILRDCLSKRDPEWNNLPFSDIVLREYKKAYNALQIVTHNNSKPVDIITFEEAFDLYNNLLQAILDNRYNKWLCKERKFIC